MSLRVRVVSSAYRSRVIAAPRPTTGPQPGDLYLDPVVPECERVTISRNGWSAQASHVWTGTGWTRLVPGVVRDVPAHPEITLSRVPAARRADPAAPVAPVEEAPSAAGIERYRRRRSARESVKELVRERAAAVDAG